MHTKENTDWQTPTLTIASVISAIIGLAILIFFSLTLAKEFTIFGDSSIILDKTGQVGDFIGGLVGSLWAFTGVLLFYLSLRLQRKEFILQREELTNQRTEFRINRLTNVIFNQISRIENQINQSIYFNKLIDSKAGISGIYSFNEQLRGTCSFMEAGEEKIDTQNDLNYISQNTKTLYELLDILSNSTKIINKLIDGSNNLCSKDKTELKFIYTENIGDEVKNMIKYIHTITKNYFFHREKEKQKDDYLMGEEGNYLKLRNITKELIDMIEY